MRLALLLATFVAAPLPAARHNRLVKAEPGVDSTVAKSPAQIRLWFKEPPELAVSYDQADRRRGQAGRRLVR